MIRILYILSSFFIISISIHAGFEKDKDCKDPCNQLKSNPTNTKKTVKLNQNPTQVIKQEKSNSINIHSGVNELKEIIRKRIQPTYSAENSIEKIKFLTREQLNKSGETKFNSKYMPSFQLKDKKLSEIYQKRDKEEILEFREKDLE